MKIKINNDKRKINNKVKIGYGFIIAIFILALFSCEDLPDNDETALIISLINDTASSERSVDNRAIYYVVSITGNGTPVQREAYGGQTVSATVSVGLWNININGYYPDMNTLYSTGGSPVDVKPGVNRVEIRMSLVSVNNPDPVPETYTVTFNSNGGSDVNPITVASGGTIATLPTPTMTNHSFDGWFTQLVGGTQFTTSTTVTADIVIYAQWTDTGPCSTVPHTPDPAETGLCTVCGGLTYELGDLGPGGGRIFYRSEEGFTVTGYTGMPGTFADYTAHYLEAAPSDSGTAQWGANGTLLNIGASTQNSMVETTVPLYMGKGRRDTLLLAAYFDANPENAPRAAQVAAAASFGGKNDWFLPSYTELLHYRDSGVTGIPTGNYWTSTQIASNAAWAIGLGGEANATGFKYSVLNVRAIRAF